MQNRYTHGSNEQPDYHILTSFWCCLQSSPASKTHQGNIKFSSFPAKIPHFKPFWGDKVRYPKGSSVNCRTWAPKTVKHILLHVFSANLSLIRQVETINQCRSTKFPANQGQILFVGGVEKMFGFPILLNWKKKMNWSENLTNGSDFRLLQRLFDEIENEIQKATGKKWYIRVSGERLLKNLEKIENHYISFRDCR